MSFLNAEWRKLILINYEIDPQILEEFVPNHTELDLWQGRCYVSLVGFMFVNTKVLGIKIPFHINFEEVNLRFYVKYKHGDEWRRGVTFIKEIVPKHAITFVANHLYKENYATMPMSHEWKKNENQLQISYKWNCKGSWQEVTVQANSTPIQIKTDSETGFITEHYFGYTKINTTKTYEYEVTHPTWQAYKVKNHKIDVNFDLVYGKQFGFLNDTAPASVMLAEGSEITVEKMRKL